MEEINIDDILKSVEIKDITDRIRELKSIDLKYQDFEELKTLVLPLIQCGLSTVIFPKRMKIHRGRIIDPETDILLNSSQISYPPKESALRFNRASTSKYQVFYGTASRIYKNQEIAHVAVNFELSKIHDTTFPDAYEYIALGRWYSIHDFRVAVVGLDSSIADKNSEALKLREFQTNLINNSPERFRVVKIVSEYLSAEFSKMVKNEFEYKISAAYGDILFDMGFQAIMFPSVKAEGRVFNIALSKEVVDSSLTCEVAAITRSQKILGNVFSDYYLVSETLNKNGTFNWQEPLANTVISNAARKQIEREIRMKGKFDDRDPIF